MPDASPLPLRRLLVAGAAVATLSACAPSVPATPAASTTAAATTTSTAAPSANGPFITSFQIIDDVNCTGSPTDVPVSWSTRNAQTVKIEIDGQPLGSVPDQPLNGISKVSLPCDGREHAVVLVAQGEGQQVSVARQVNTSAAPPPATAPSITRFDVLDDVTCGGGTVDVPGAWVTQNAQAVNFSVDGQPLPAAAGFPTTGVGNIAVPCDGAAHKVTLTASGSGPAASLSRSVNTSLSSGGGGTTTTQTRLSGVTEIPRTR